MTSLISFQTLNALPPLTPPKGGRRITPSTTCSLKLPFNSNPNSNSARGNAVSLKIGNNFGTKNLLVQLGILATVAEPAIAVTGVNYEPDYVLVAIQVGVVAFFYFLIMPPIIMNWLRIRWYRRNLVEMYFQFMFVFLFFPGVLVWAPFLNFRKFPRDPTMKYPWSKPENPDEIKEGFLKFPWASIEDYET